MESQVNCWLNPNSIHHLGTLYCIRISNGPNEASSTACVSGPSKPDVEGQQWATYLPHSHAAQEDGWYVSFCGPPILGSIPLLSVNTYVSSTPRIARPLAHSRCATDTLDIVNEQQNLLIAFFRDSFLPLACPTHLIERAISLTTPRRPHPGLP